MDIFRAMFQWLNVFFDELCSGTHKFVYTRLDRNKVLCEKMALMCFYAGFTEGKYLGIDNGGNMRVNSLRAVILAWLNAFQRSRV